MELYDAYVAVHVIGAVAWVGGNTMMAMTSRRVINRNHPQEIESFVSDLVFLTPRFFIPISLLTVAFGAISVVEGPWEFSDPWVGMGMTMFLVSFLIGVAYLGPRAERLQEMAADGLIGSNEYTSVLSRFILASRIELALLWLTVIVMVIKPG